MVKLFNHAIDYFFLWFVRRVERAQQLERLLEWEKRDALCRKYGIA
jgi:hypothetical protein